MGLDYSVIFERMLKAGNLRNSSQMAKMLGMTPQAMSSYKRRGELSAGLIFKFATLCNVSVDWLLTGEGEVFRPLEGVQPTQEVCSIALVERVAGEAGGPGKKTKGKGAGPDPMDTAVLNPDELIYLGKLLKILRCREKTTVPALKANIDAFFLSAFPPNAPY
jgi:transcriptional regulator with XRE-family HTH domain